MASIIWILEVVWMKYKILVVDDDKELVKMLCSYFNMKQYETITATDGMEALNKIKMKPDIILLDINMPRMDGIEVCRLIRSKVLCPILFLTARVDEDDKINGLLSGGDDYITKPFSLRELEARIVTNIKREERHQQKTEYRFMDEMLIDYSEKIVAIAGHRMEFTKIEYQIIEFLSMHPGQVFDKERIYAQVCGYDAEGDSRTITELVRRIRKKNSGLFRKRIHRNCMGDWIPMEKIRNLSLKKTILLYFVISLTAAFLLSGFTVHFAGNMQNKIWGKYIDYADYTDVFQQYGKKYEIEISRPNQSQMNRLDYHLSEMCDFMETYSVLIFSIVGSVVAVFFFYKNKLKTPLQELKDASQMIADNELDFHVSYENKDEMGTLCKEFEMMRSDLADNNRKMWRMIDDEKALRNAIAHDIRSPLSILRGYQEMLLEFVSAESIKTEDVIDILQTGMYQIDRIEHFTENMRKMSHLEQRELQCSEIELSELVKKIEAEAAMLSKKESKLCKVERVQEQNIVKVDEELVMEVTDNLLENAIRYAQKSIALQIKKKEGFLIISVEDDGIGFVDTEEKVTEPFYHKNPQDDLKHFGLGMYISRIFCEKHGGNLKIYNARQGGAHVEALFKAE